jgi:hypothetical protein
MGLATCREKPLLKQLYSRGIRFRLNGKKLKGICLIKDPGVGDQHVRQLIANERYSPCV